MQRTKKEAGSILYTKWFGHPHFTLARVDGGWRATSKIVSAVRPVLTLMDGTERPVEVCQ